MNRNFYFLLIFLGLIFMSSCSSSRRVGRSIPASTLNTQVNLSMEDLDYIGEVKGTSTQTYLLGLPIGGRRQYFGQIAIGSAGFNHVNFQSRGMSNALYDALNSRQDIDFVLPIAYDFEVHRMFLGRKVKINLRAKAFKIKVQTAVPAEEKKEEEKKDE